MEGMSEGASTAPGKAGSATARSKATLLAKESSGVRLRGAYLRAPTCVRILTDRRLLVQASCRAEGVRSPMMRASLKLKSVDLASAEEEEDLMVSKGKERAMKLTSLHTLPHGNFIVWSPQSLWAR